MDSVTVVDYGMGNIASIERAFHTLSVKVIITSDPELVLKADRIVIPGVGAFGDSINELKNRNLIEAIKIFVSKGNPLLGICLGMQILFEESEELGIHNGLGLVQGQVKVIPKNQISISNNSIRKIPHIGWNSIYNEEGKWNKKIFNGISENNFFYFIHSYMCIVKESNITLAITDYDGCKITAAIESGNILGLQFHPEKSASLGIKILDNFMKFY